MDPLSLSASLIAVIGLTGSIVSLCREYLSSVKGAPHDLRVMMVDMGCLKCVIENLQFLIAEGADEALSKNLESLAGPNGPVQGCKVALIALEKLLPPVVVIDGAKRRSKTLSLAQLAWPFKEVKAKKLLDELSRYKSTINLALTSDILQHVRAMDSKLSGLCDSLDHMQRDTILDWLTTTNPSSNHNVASDLRDEDTGTWLDRCPEYKAWEAGTTRFLWFHGIPGAGKTVLFSHLVEESEALRESAAREGERSCVRVYYYCYHGHAQDETVPFLCWTISQLSRQCGSIPEELLRCHEERIRPSIQILKRAISVLAPQFKRIYLLLDALDESRERRNICELLLLLAGTGFENVSILATSRQEIDITNHIGSVAQAVSLSNPYVDEDIRIFVDNQSKNHPNLRRWPQELQNEICAALVIGAKGMFRWAACQIDIIGRLHNPGEIRKALKRLPETLDETYERILLDIGETERPLAHKALQLLAFDGEDFEDLREVEILSEAVVIDLESRTFDPSNRLLRLDSLLEICRCLISEHDGLLRLAHYTVKEYLMSPRVSHGPTSYFSIDQASSDVMYAKIALIYTLSVPFDDYLTQEVMHKYWTEEEEQFLLEPLLEKFPLLRKVAHWFAAHDRFKCSLADQKDIDDLVLSLLDQGRNNYQGWLEFQAIWLFTRVDFLFPLWRSSPEHSQAITVAYACFLSRPDLAAKLLSDSPDLATANLIDDIYVPWRTKIVNRNGASFDLDETAGDTLLQVAVSYNQHTVVDILLQNGADPNSPALWLTPLQRCAYYGNYEDAEKLLAHRADVNATCDSKCVVAEMGRLWGNLEPSSLKNRINEKVFADERSILAYNYSSPLKIVEQQARERVKQTKSEDNMEALLRDKNSEYGKLYALLQQHGGALITRSPWLNQEEQNNYRENL